MTAAANQSTEQIGTLIGRYKLLEQVGEGGMGIVYVAEQTEPVRRSDWFLTGTGDKINDKTAGELIN